MAIVYHNNNQYKRVYTSSRAKVYSHANIAEGMSIDYDSPCSYAITVYLRNFPSDVSLVEADVTYTLYDTDGGETTGKIFAGNLSDGSSLGTFETDNLCAIESFKVSVIVHPVSEANKAKYISGVVEYSV